MTEMVHDPHRADLHQRAVAEHGAGTSMTIDMKQQYPTPLYSSGLLVITYDPVILVSDELVQTMIGGIEGIGGWVNSDDSVMRVVADNADLTYQLEHLPCGCWLGRLTKD